MLGVRTSTRSTSSSARRRSSPPQQVARRRDLAEVGEREVLADRAAHQEALGLAALGQQRDPVVDRLPRRADADLLAVEAEDARRARVGAEDGVRDLGAAAADEARRGRGSRRRGSRSDVPEQPLRLEALDREHDRRLGAGRGLRREVRLHRAAEHRADDRGGGLAGRGGRLHELAVAEHGDRVGDREHLLEEVRDEHDRRAPRRGATAPPRAAWSTPPRSAPRWARPSRSAWRRARARGGSRPSAGRRAAARRPGAEAGIPNCAHSSSSS